MVLDLAKNDADRAALELLIARLEYGRPYFVPPGVPDDRVQALRRAFDATMKDPEFLADAKKLSLEIDPITGEQAQELIARVLETPQPIAERVRKAIEPRAEGARSLMGGLVRRSTVSSATDRAIPRARHAALRSPRASGFTPARRKRIKLRHQLARQRHAVLEPVGAARCGAPAPAAARDRSPAAASTCAGRAGGGPSRP